MKVAVHMLRTLVRDHAGFIPTEEVCAIPVVAHRTANGRKWHATQYCSHLRGRDVITSVPTTVGGILTDSCDCLLEVDGVAHAIRELTEAERLSTRIRAVESSTSATSLSALAAALRRTESTEATARFSRDWWRDARRRGAAALDGVSDRVDDVERDRILRLAFVRLITADSADAEVEAELGAAPNRVFASRYSSNAWTRLADRVNAQWATAAIDGDVAAVRAVAASGDPLEAARAAADTGFGRGVDPGRLSFTGDQFSSPSEWAEAEFHSAIHRAVGVAFDTWTAKLDELLEAVDGPMVVAWIPKRRTHERQTAAVTSDRTARDALAALYRPVPSGSGAALVAPEVVAVALGWYLEPTLSSTALHFGACKVLGPAPASMDRHSLELLGQLIDGGATLADAYEMAMDVFASAPA